MKYIFKILVLLITINLHIVYANSTAQDALDKATVYYEKKEYQEAIKWLKVSYKEEATSEVCLNFGLVYEDMKKYEKAVRWYEEAYNKGEADGGYNLGLLYYIILNDIDNSIKWYKKAIDKGHISAIKNLGYLYRTEKKDNLLGSAYMIGLIDKKYSKEKVLTYLRTKLKIDEATLKKAYELQKTLVPDPYTGGID